MSGSPAELRNKAAQQRAAAEALLSGLAASDVNAVKVVPVIVGYMTANNYEIMADAVEYLRGTVGMDSAMARRRAVLERNDAIRAAASKGDWNEFDRLVAGGGG